MAQVFAVMMEVSAVSVNLSLIMCSNPVMTSSHGTVSLRPVAGWFALIMVDFLTVLPFVNFIILRLCNKRCKCERCD